MAHGSTGIGESTPRSRFHDRGRFGRLFGGLPPFAADTPLIREALAEIGAPGGPMDALDDLADPVTLITDPAKSAHNANNPTMTAGFTFLGQFLDHDMTFDPTSSLARRQDPESIRNFRIPAAGPGQRLRRWAGRLTAPLRRDRQQWPDHVPRRADPGFRRVSIDGSLRYDVPRNSQLSALTGDPRNDENLMVSQLNLAFLRFHNRGRGRCSCRSRRGQPAEEIFAEAQRMVRWHYQWMVLHEFLPATVGEQTTKDVLEHGRRFYTWRNDPFIPVEFSVAAYRFGHSQVRPSYRANFGTSATDATQQFFALIFDPDATDPTDPKDLRGGRRAARRFIDWQTFFDFGDGRARPNKKIDTVLSTPLFSLLGQPAGTPTSLATRNLVRNLTMGVPSGQGVAAAMQLPPLAPADLADLSQYTLHERTPLWFYVLREAQVTSAGEHLGPVGGRIVAEVIVGLIQGDSTSYLRQDPDWTPTYGSDDNFTVVDLLRAAGVVATFP